MCITIGDWVGGIVTEKGYERGSEGINGGNIGFAYDYDKSAVVSSEETVIYLGLIANIWGI